jgi:hypothetical protein
LRFERKLRPKLIHQIDPREPTLPDVSLLHGRMLVSAWESGLEFGDEILFSFFTESVISGYRK